VGGTNASILYFPEKRELKETEEGEGGKKPAVQGAPRGEDVLFDFFLKEKRRAGGS